MRVVVREMVGGDLVERDITGCFDIRFGEGPEQITVCIRDGRVEARCDWQMLVLPRAANTVQIMAQDYPPAPAARRGG